MMGILVAKGLHTATSFHNKTGTLLKVINVFQSAILTLFTVTSIQSISKRTRKPENLKQGNKNKTQQ